MKGASFTFGLLVATVAFQDAGGRLLMRVTAWPIPQLGQALVAGPQWGTYLS